MERLVNYTKDEEPFRLEADLQIQGQEIRLDFHVVDSQGLLTLPRDSGRWNLSQAPRADELWKGTCFEAFLKPESEDTGYYEFNFSLSPAWNAYKLESYRRPQPPTRTDDFILKTTSWDGPQGRLRAVLENKSLYQSFQVGLTAILVERGGRKHYYALAHTGKQPDFHLADSFILDRRAKI